MDKTIQKILVPVDFSSYATEALHYAATIADRFVSSLIVLHVIPKDVETIATQTARRSIEGVGSRGRAGDYVVGISFGQVDLREDARRELRQFLPSQFREREVEQRVEVGPPVEQILALTQREQVDLIVMGTRGRTGLARMVMGSVAEQVVRQAPCPVLMVKTPPTEA